MRVGIYARVSTNNQEKDGTIEPQIALDREYVAARPEWSLVAVYADDGYSSELLKRPGLDRLLDDAAARRIDAVLALNPDRLSRVFIYREVIKNHLKEKGVQVHFIDQAAATDTPEGALMDGIVGLFAQYEKERIALRMRRGRDHRVERDRIAWRSVPPFGWCYHLPGEGERDGHLAPDPVEAAVVRQIFAWALAGRTCFWVAAELNRMGVKTRKAGTWTPSNVARLIHNPIHKGEAVHGRFRSHEPERSTVEYRRVRKSSTRINHDASTWVSCPVEAIVEAATWDLAQEALSRNRTVASRNGRFPYLLTGLVRCGRDHPTEPGRTCGRSMIGDRGKYYECTRFEDVDGRRVFCGHRIRVDELEGAVWGHLMAMLRRPDIALAEARRAIERRDGERLSAARTLEAASRRVEELQARLEKLTARYLDDHIDEATYRRMADQIVAERDQAGADVARLEELARRPEVAERASWGDVERFCKHWAALTEGEVPAEGKRELIRLLVRSIAVRGDEVAIDGTIPTAAQLEATDERLLRHDLDRRHTIAVPFGATLPRLGLVLSA